jgi:hypothetical protein
MARRTRAARASPAPVKLNPPTPITSAHHSQYTSEAEADAPNQDFDLEPDTQPAPKPKRAKAFRFLDLPTELRLRVYGYYFADCGSVIDLSPDNYRRIHKQLRLFRTCRQIYNEAAPYFFSAFTFRVFPISPGRFFKTKKPLLARLTPHQRSWITSLELRLGPGFNNPPRGWVVNDALGLRDCVRVRKLRVYVEIDPSDNALKGFRRAEGFYEDFSSRLMREILTSVPGIEVVEFDAWSSVKISGRMMQGLLKSISPTHQLAWGPERGWNGASTTHELMDSDAGICGFENLTLVDYIPA